MTNPYIIRTNPVIFRINQYKQYKISLFFFKSMFGFALIFLKFPKSSGTASLARFIRVPLFLTVSRGFRRVEERKKRLEINSLHSGCT